MSARWTPEDLANYRERMTAIGVVATKAGVGFTPLVKSIGKFVKSTLEAEMALQIKAAGLPAPQLEFAFAKPRRWRFDFAWPDRKVALETEGGEWSGGRHTRGEGFTNDCIKYSEAAIRGWKVIRVTGKMIKEGLAIELLKRALASRT